MSWIVIKHFLLPPYYTMKEALLLQDLKRILDFVDALPRVEEGEAEEALGRLREDEPRPSLPQAETLALAPEAEDGFFRVPPVLE